MNGYRIPIGRVRVEHVVSNSRFIATADRASSVEQAKALLREIRQEMPDATHHVYAFQVGHGKSVTEGMSDDGEPSGTAGPPALAVVRGADAGDVALVITRYYGGTKLGTGGLVSAYGTAAKLAMAALKTEEKVERHTFNLAIPYALHRAVEQTLHASDGRVLSQEFGAQVDMKCDIPTQKRTQLEQALGDISGGAIKLEEPK